VTENTQTPIADWSDQGLLATINSNFGVGADAGLPPELRFLMGVVRVMNNRRREIMRIRGDDVIGQEEAMPAVFFYAPQPPASVDAKALKPAPMLDNGLTPIGGNFWFVGPLATRGCALKLDDWPDDGEVFDSAIENLEIGDVPAVLFENRTGTPQLRHYPAGLAKPEDVSVVALGGERIDIKRVLEVIDNAHSAHLVTPQGSAVVQLWKDRGKYWPMPDAERKIQFILRVALQSAFPATVIREEQPQTSGRLDLEIEESQRGGVVRHALLELKVLRSYGSTGRSVSGKENGKAIEEGIRQAASYRDERDTIASALCCFDMRKTCTEEQCFSTVRATAGKRKVHLRVWHIFASAREHRAASC
jgi:hypothetical protein